MPTVLDHREILDAAGYATGHFNVLDSAFGARLERLVGWLKAHGGLAPQEIVAARRQLLQIVISRIALAADRARIPAIARERIERPIVVIGYSRTGTTLLQSLLAEDEANRAPMWWQSHQPSPPPGERPVTPARLDLARRELQRFLEAAPGMLTMHPYWDKYNEALIEDEQIHTLALYNTYPTLLFQVPAFPVMGGSEDPAGAYRFQTEFLQHHQWNQPRRRWVVKGCFHQFYLKRLFEAYPDALCIWPHRDPLDLHASTLAIMAVLYGSLTNGKLDWRQIAAGYLEGVRQATETVLADPLVDDPRIVHLRFADVAKDPIAAIRSIYRQAGFEYTERFEARMRAWLESPANRPDRYGRYPYSLEPFGLAAAAVRAAFASYSKRFGVD